MRLPISRFALDELIKLKLLPDSDAGSVSDPDFGPLLTPTPANDVVEFDRNRMRDSNRERERERRNVL